jgi:hypothetical protein
MRGRGMCPMTPVCISIHPTHSLGTIKGIITYWLKKTLTSGATRIVDGHYIVKTHKGFKKVKIDMENINQEIKIEKL